MNPLSAWHGQLPSHWRLVPLRYLAELGTGHTPDRNKIEYWTDCTIPWVTAADLSSRLSEFEPLMETQQHVSELGVAKSSAVIHPAGTVMLCRTASVGLITVIGRPMATTQAFVTWTTGQNLLSRYLLYALSAMRPELFRIAYGSTHLTIYMPDLEALHIPLPPVQEQHRIVAFLDEQVGTLERAASAHSRILSLRNERIDALVSRFLASTVYDAPDRTSLVPMKRILSKIVTPTSWSPGGVVTAFRDGQVTARSQRRAEGYTEASSENSLAQEVKRGDLVIHGLDGFAGAIGTSESDGVCSPAYHVCRVNNGDSDFYGRLLRLMAINGYLSLYGGSSRERAVDFRNWGSFSRTPIPVVLREEQERIGDMIRSLRPLSAKVSHLQSLINERKQALITLAVTGQLDVTTARAVA